MACCVYVLEMERLQTSLGARGLWRRRDAIRPVGAHLATRHRAL